MKPLLPLFALCAATLLAQPQRFRIMEWNVENLFDTLDAPGKEDGAFTPQGNHRWNSGRYWSKQGKLSRTIAAAGGNTPIDLIALIEIENDSTLAHLTRRTKLWRLGYEYIASHSADPRGINVGLIYQPYRFQPIHTNSLRIFPPKKKMRQTRDVLHVAGQLPNGDTLDVIIAHLPSRRGAQEAALYRLMVNRQIRQYIGQLLTRRQHPAIVLTGDFNAFYPEPSITQGLEAKLPASPFDHNALYILTHEKQAQQGIKGTYHYQGYWNQLDQFFVNGGLLHPGEATGKLYTSPSSCKIVDLPFLLEPIKNAGGFKPFRSYLGPYYHGGYSDHLPVILELYYSPKE